MRTRYGKLRYRPRRKYIRRARSTKRGSVSNKVKNYVKKAIHANLENKESIQYGANQSISNIVSGSTPGGIALLPSCGQGTSNSSRTGNQIKIVKGFIRGFVNILPYNSVSNPLSTPVYVKMWLVRSLADQAQLGVGSVDWTKFFKTSGGSVGFQGNMLDACLDVNNDLFRVFQTKTIKIGAGYASSTGQVGTGGYYDNSSMSRPFYFNWGKHCRKFLKYNDNDSPYLPTNQNLYLVMNTFYADGSNSGLTPAEYHYTSVCRFEDA